MKPIYDDLSKDELLVRCVGGFTQNNNQSLNQLIRKITAKILPASSKIVNIAALVGSCYSPGALNRRKFYDSLSLNWPQVKTNGFSALSLWATPCAPRALTYCVIGYRLDMHG
ncbi:hypothetical protein EVAR_38689_1 [Eumeta japonica]|uniref:Uncharacterized protein n=1 Tax=Eumeta variegata TaxID=151549 RepID=A0A4C1Y7X7_EUMVA|nr:hypothetical protein EVAR_38689_1 [Eumeta japonica]